ncbi:uncharacterized protein BDCG_05467 [Blastomyces dermatitidis ER-3]|uniref:Uncharacterized protein n=1 Tax=Ajellomyces dermatitidis (strain ER-3 / ATCC MYA-2586) TaxID=559297 RepID=A0ABP2F518_AJEDR|nr:uncharacterized protein BDCG_05467 [Blastomyces dermatitidis ER-3]EEQ90347.2 hypothetical protein BDCG_05467 [Blastomyces dermatitidis ER-3]
MTSATVHLSVPGDWKLWYTHMLGYAKDKKVSDFINLDKPDIFSELEEPLEPECPEEATAEAKIAYDIKVTAWKIKYMKYEKMNEGMMKIRDIIWRTVDATELRHLLMQVIHKLGLRMSDVIKMPLSLIELVKDFKEQYREMGILKEDKSMNFAAFNGRSQQNTSSPVTFKNCICGACHRYTQCYYLNPSRKSSGWEENREKRTQINQALKNQELKRHVDCAISRDSSANTDMIDGAVLEGMILKQSDPQSIDLQI